MTRTREEIFATRILGVGFEALATVLAGLDDGIAPERILAHADVDPGAWPRAKEAWDEHILEDLEDDGIAAELLEEAKARALVRWKRPLPPLDSDLRAWLDFERAWMHETEPDVFLAARGMRASDISRLEQLWAERWGKDPALERQALAILCDAPGDPVEVTPGPVELPARAAERYGLTLEPRAGDLPPPSVVPETPRIAVSHAPALPFDGKLKLRAPESALDDSPHAATGSTQDLDELLPPSALGKPTPFREQPKSRSEPAPALDLGKRAAPFDRAPPSPIAEPEKPRRPSTEAMPAIDVAKLAEMAMPFKSPPPASPGERGVPAGPGERGVPAGPGERGVPAGPTLTCEQHAVMCAELRSTPHAAAAIFERYGLADAARRQAVDSYWKALVTRDKAAYAAWTGSYWRAMRQFAQRRKDRNQGR